MAVYIADRHWLNNYLQNYRDTYNIAFRSRPDVSTVYNEPPDICLGTLHKPDTWVMNHLQIDIA